MDRTRFKANGQKFYARSRLHHFKLAADARVAVIFFTLFRKIKLKIIFNDWYFSYCRKLGYRLIADSNIV